jgi:hypothetical protein
MDEILKDVSTLYRMVAEINVVASRLRAEKVHVSLCGVADRSDPLSRMAEIHISLPVNTNYERRD